MGGVFKKMLFDKTRALQALRELEENGESVDKAARDYVAEVVQDVLATPVEIEVRLEPGAKMPTQPYPTDACWDLYARKHTKVPAHMTSEIPTGVYVNIPKGYEGELKTRSSWGKNGLFIHHSVFDAGYQGEVTPFVHNHTSEDFEAKSGDRVAQFCLRRKVPVVWKEVAELTPSIRGTHGHGSSGR